MPELPEVETVARGMNQVLVGNKISAIKFYRDNLRTNIPKKELKKILVEQKVVSVFRRSKYILIETNIGNAILHLGMTGNVLCFSSKEPKIKHTHFVIEVNGVEGSRFLHYVDPRRFGLIDVYFGSDWSKHKLLVSLGPEPLESPRLSQHLYEKSRQCNVPIKSFLMNAGNVVGVGNIYACESLFMAGIDPRLPSKNLDLKSFQKIAKSIKKTLKAAIKAGGTTLKDYKNLKGDQGYFAIDLKVYGRSQKPCVQCGNDIETVRLAGRSTFFCAFCQK
ncbi:MAG: bifunctional DNA-formamidopyrimidine glycosylase/DNA-(apurinic or apyrimidinic site) lyase [Bdellovibrionota bacterium]